MADDEAPSGSSRSKRQKFDKHGRFAALERLRQSKGIKHKAELKDVEKVYDEVDEREYTKRVLERQNDDWIVDEGIGYVEDGREIFDDDLDDESIAQAARLKNKSKKRKSGKDRGDDAEESKGGGNIRHMLMNMQTKKKKTEDVKLEDDVNFENILQELETTPIAPMSIKPQKASSQPRNHSNGSSSYMNGSSNKSLTNYEKMPSNHSNGSYMNGSSNKSLTNQEKKPSSVAVRKIDTVVKPVEIKEEPMETESQIIDDYDSDDFSAQDFEALDNTVEEVQTQQLVSSPAPKQLKIEPVTQQVKPAAVVIKTEKPVPQPKLHNAESSWDCMTVGLPQSESDIKPAVNGEVKVLEDGQLPTVTLPSGDEVFRMFWWDAYEDVFKHPGVVYLFGKTKLGDQWASVCLIVRNIEKHVLLLPRQYAMVGGEEQTDQPVSITDVYTEFNTQVARKHKIMEFKSRSVSRKYAFNLPGVPVEADYLEVVYPGTGPVLPSDLSGETFSHVFGTNTSSLETLLLQRKLKGPCWLDIKGAKKAGNPISWCKLEVILQDPGDIVVSKAEKLTPPPLSTMTVNLRIAVNPKTLHNEVVMASCLLSPQFPVDQPPQQPFFQSHFCILTRPSECAFPHDYHSTMGKNSGFKATTLHRVDSERALLSLLLTLIFRADPDLLVGHDIANFDLPTLLARLAAHKVENWSRLGRLRRSGLLQHQQGKVMQLSRSTVCGRLVCDVKLSAQELIRARSYDLDTLCQQVLKIPEGQREVVTVEEIRNCYSSGTSLRNLVCLSMQDAAYILRMMCELNAIPLALQITTIAGNVMSRTLMGGRSERNEFLLLHAFDERGYVVPDKVYGAKQKIQTPEEGDEEVEDGGGSKKARRKKAAYSGGLVLEPKKGFYDNFILLMDFNSLYPSIIQEYNICFTTLVAAKPAARTSTDEDLGGDDGMDELLASVAAAQAAPPGVLPMEIKKLVDKRRAVKGLLARGNLPPEEKMQLNIRQMALKLTANSMYGCLGFSHSRFYAKHLAALVTAKGRDILMLTKSLVEKMGLDVVYGDTDSIMINTRSTSYDEVLKLGFKVKGEVNKLYQSVELEVDGIFKYLLLLKKKKYAALTISRLPDGSFRTEQELKGLDIVRRDWAPLAADTGRFVLQLLLGDINPDERLAQLHERLSELRGQLERGEVPAAQLAVAKTLARNPDQYQDKKGLPHVLVAARLNAKGGRKLKQGDTVHYVICNDGTSVAATQRAYHLEELKTNPDLKIDVEYYLAHQIHPVVSRLVECLDGTDAVRIAECLGLDAANYKHAIRREEEEQEGFKQISQFSLPEEERFKHCDRFKFKCQGCNEMQEMKGAWAEGLKSPIPSLEKCSNSECRFKPINSLPYLQNCLALAIRACIAKYYEGWLVCEDPRCSARSRGISNKFQGQLPVCRKCNQGNLLPEYSEHDLHQQIYYYRFIFTLKKRLANDAAGTSRETGAAYLKLREQAEKVINLSSYCVVDLTTLFRKLQTKKSTSSSQAC